MAGQPKGPTWEQESLLEGGYQSLRLELTIWIQGDGYMEQVGWDLRDAISLEQLRISVHGVEHGEPIEQDAMRTLTEALSVCRRLLSPF